MKQLIVAVDENSFVLEQIKQSLFDKYDVEAFIDGREAIEFVENNDVDLVILDIAMKSHDGFDIYRKLRKIEGMEELGILFLLDTYDESIILKSYEMGAANCLIKPFVPQIFEKSIGVHMELARQKKKLEKYAQGLETLAYTKINELYQMHGARTHQELDNAIKTEAPSMMSMYTDIIITALAKLIYTHDKNIKENIERTPKIMEILAKACLASGRFDDELDEDKIETIVAVTPIHDIGHIAISEKVLSCDGKMSREDFEMMKSHVDKGVSLIMEIAEEIPNNKYIETALAMVKYHHEHFDANGYPDGVSGEDIPIEARLMRVVDIYDAVIRERAYRPALSHEEALAIINEGSGEIFDPNIIEVFNEISEDIQNLIMSKA